jgi:hypothetical protein
VRKREQIRPAFFPWLEVEKKDLVYADRVRTHMILSRTDDITFQPPALPATQTLTRSSTNNQPAGLASVARAHDDMVEQEQSRLLSCMLRDNNARPLMARQQPNSTRPIAQQQLDGIITVIRRPGDGICLATPTRRRAPAPRHHRRHRVRWWCPRWVASELRSARAPGHMYSSDMATRGRSASFSRGGCVTAS